MHVGQQVTVEHEYKVGVALSEPSLLSHLLNIYEQKLLTDWLIQHHVTCRKIKDFPVLQGNLSPGNLSRDFPAGWARLFINFILNFSIWPQTSTLVLGV